MNNQDLVKPWIAIFLGFIAVLCACYVAVQLCHALSELWQGVGPIAGRPFHSALVIIRHYLPAAADDLEQLAKELSA